MSAYPILVFAKCASIFGSWCPLQQQTVDLKKKVRRDRPLTKRGESEVVSDSQIGSLGNRVVSRRVLYSAGYFGERNLSHYI